MAGVVKKEATSFFCFGWHKQPLFGIMVLNEYSRMTLKKEEEEWFEDDLKAASESLWKLIRWTTDNNDRQPFAAPLFDNDEACRGNNSWLGGWWLSDLSLSSWNGMGHGAAMASFWKGMFSRQNQTSSTFNFQLPTSTRCAFFALNSPILYIPWLWSTMIKIMSNVFPTGEWSDFLFPEGNQKPSISPHFPKDIR